MNRKRQQILMVAVFAAVLVFLTVAEVILPARARSDLENRSLAQVPAIPTGVQGFQRYARAWDAYFLDQVPFRETWLRLYSFAEVRVLGKGQMNGVVVGEDGYLLRLVDPPARSLAELDGKIAQAAQQVAKLDDRLREYGGHLLYVIVPDKPAFMRGNYPSHVDYPALRDLAPPRFLAALSSRDVDALDLGPLLETRRDRQLYFRTDHHWTFEGAYLGYSAIMRALGLPFLQPGDLEYSTLGNSFVGSENRLMGMAVQTDDQLSIGIPRNAAPYSLMLGPRDTRKGRSLYRLPTTISASVSYESVYPYRSDAQVIIDTHRPELPDVLLVGDSFKGPVVCLLYPSFNQTRTLDLRRYEEMSVIDYVEEHKPDYVVFLLSGTFYLQSTWTVLDE